MDEIDYSWETVSANDNGTYTEEFEVPDEYVERSGFLDSLNDEDEDVITYDKLE